MMRHWFLLPCTLLSLVFSDIAHADLVISFSADGSAANFDVRAGETIDVPVYIFEDSGSSILIDHGLSAGASGVSYDVTPGSATATDAALATHWDAGSPFNATSTNNSTGIAILQGGISFDSDPVTPPAGTSSILIGTIAFQGNQAGNITTLTSFDPDTNNSDVLSGSDSREPLDDDVFATSTSATISTTAVPEPGALCLSSALLGAFCIRRRLRRERHTGGPSDGLDR